MNYLIPAVSNGIIGLLSTLYLMLVLHKKRGFAATFFPLLLAMELSLVGAFFLNASFLPRVLMVVITFMVVTRLLFADAWLRRALSIGLMYMSVWACELLFAVLTRQMTISPELVLMQTPMNQLAAFSAYLAIFAFLLWMCTLMLNRRADQFSSQEMLLYILFPIGQCLLICGNLHPQDYGSNDVIRIAAVVVCFASDIGLYLAVRGMAQRSELKQANERLSWQIEAQQQHYTALTAQLENMRILRHDIANHMYTMQALLAEGKTEQASAYAAELIPMHTFHASLGRCENLIVDAFLFSRINDAQAKGVPIESQVFLPAELKIANADLVSIFGNLLDNAEAACLSLEACDRYIRLWAHVADNVLTIRTENPPSSGEAAPRIPGLNRGIGLHILENMAQKYHGVLLTGEQEGCFRSELTLRFCEG